MAILHRASTNSGHISHPIKRRTAARAALVLVLAATVTVGAAVNQPRIAPTSGATTMLAHGGNVAPNDSCLGCG